MAPFNLTRFFKISFNTRKLVQFLGQRKNYLQVVNVTLKQVSHPVQVKAAMLKKKFFISLSGFSISFPQLGHLTLAISSLS